MVGIKNIEAKDLQLNFEGTTYLFPKGTVVLVDQKVVDHIKEIWPLAFEFNLALPKGKQVSKVKESKTRSVFGFQPTPVQDMKVTQAGTQRNTFVPDSETQGPDYYGAGIEEDKI
jgi:hypothetical protein